jgi:hypothetical protein
MTRLEVLFFPWSTLRIKKVLSLCGCEERGGGREVDHDFGDREPVHRVSLGRYAFESGGKRYGTEVGYDANDNRQRAFDDLCLVV